MKDITMQASLQTIQKNFTNHSMRKTVVKKLKKAGVATRDIAAITGHKSEESLRDYDDDTYSGKFSYGGNFRIIRMSCEHAKI